MKWGMRMFLLSAVKAPAPQVGIQPREYEMRNLKGVALNRRWARNAPTYYLEMLRTALARPTTPADNAQTDRYWVVVVATGEVINLSTKTEGGRLYAAQEAQDGEQAQWWTL